MRGAMAIPGFRATIVLLCAGPLLVACHEEERRLFTLAQRLHHIWGRCDQWDQSYAGCSLRDAQCSDRISPGPDDADIEITLEGLPASTPSQEFHMQWWSAHKSAGTCDPLVSLVNCSVYTNTFRAYPTYHDERFNGGNLRISEDGTATIRIRSPATYFMQPFLAIPHIHLRFCRGQALAEMTSGAVYLGEGEQWVLSGTHFTGTEIRIRHIGRYEHPRPEEMVRAPPGPTATYYIAGVVRPPSRATTMTATVTTTTATTSTTTTTTLSARQVMIQAAQDSMLDLDALEFSAVYRCLMDNMFFNHVSDECAPTCPAHTEATHGQCATPESEAEHSVFGATWRLEVQCETESCVHNKLNTTLHFARLSVASHLDVPFQEVTASLAYENVLGRRLSAITPVLLQIQVTTKRHEEDVGANLLSTYLTDAAMASQLLGLQVTAVTFLDGPYDGPGIEIAQQGPDNDLYTPAYEEAEHQTSSPLNAALGRLPIVVTILIGVAVLILGSALFAFMWYRRRQHLKQLAQLAEVQGKVVGVEEPVPEKTSQQDEKVPDADEKASVPEGPVHMAVHL